jgi:xanthine/CO dehydrogenase XdhC/CoxF family maturation factor
MKEIRNIVSAFDQWKSAGRRAALAVVARVEGSSYRRTGARMLVLDDGTCIGGISGGCLEGDALRRAQKAIAANRPSLVTYDTSRDDHHQIGIGLGCNGIIDVLFTPLDTSDSPHNPITLLRKNMFTRKPVLLATITGAGAEGLLGRVIPFENEEQWLRDFPLPEIANAVLADGRDALNNCVSRTSSFTASGGEMIRVCLETLIPALRLVLFGSNSDIAPMARIGRELGWDVTLVAPPLKVDKSIYAFLEKTFDPREDARPELDAFSAVVLMAHDYKTDFGNLADVLRSTAPYIGLLGPRKRAQKMFETLAGAGNPLDAADEARVFAPAGLDIGASTPEEIALSIAAEIRACFAGRSGFSLRLREKSIHDV